MSKDVREEAKNIATRMHLFSSPAKKTLYLTDEEMDYLAENKKHYQDVVSHFLFINGATTKEELDNKLSIIVKNNIGKFILDNAKAYIEIDALPTTARDRVTAGRAAASPPKR